jgi:Leucine-rich repeat (LRR) protein/serine/threonine protein phosphatase PrpC
MGNVVTRRNTKGSGGVNQGGGGSIRLDPAIARRLLLSAGTELATSYVEQFVAAARTRHLDLSGLGIAELPKFWLWGLVENGGAALSRSKKSGAKSKSTIVVVQNNNNNSGGGQESGGELGGGVASSISTVYEDDVGIVIEELSLSVNNLCALPSEFFVRFRDELKVLRLAVNRLHSVPPHISLLRHLTELDLCNNMLTAVPPHLSVLTSLTVLKLAGNYIRVLPGVVVQHLTRLEHLELQGNMLAALPPEIENLQRLSSLTVERNRLASLPRELERLTTLRVFHVYENRLTAMPTSLAALTSIGRLGLHANRIGAVDLDLCAQLQGGALDLSDNRIATLTLNGSPSDASSLCTTRSAATLANKQISSSSKSSASDDDDDDNDDDEKEKRSIGSSWVEGAQRRWNVTTLNLSKNRLRRVHPLLFRLTSASLEAVALFDNELDELPDAFVDMRRLRMLDAAENQLSTLPPTMTSLSLLVDLNLSRNELIYSDALEHAFAGMSELQQLDLSLNRLERVPASIGALAHLASLNLSFNEISELPDSFAQLDAMKEGNFGGAGKLLSIAYNRFEQFPQVVLELTGLKQLHASGNAFASVPDALGDALGALELLSLGNNRAPLALPPSIGGIATLRRLMLRGTECEPRAALGNVLEALLNEREAPMPPLVDLDLDARYVEPSGWLPRMFARWPVYLRARHKRRESRMHDVGAAKSVGAALKNEDRLIAHAHLTEHVDYFAVFDGHAGTAAADYALGHFDTLVAASLDQHACLQDALTATFFEVHTNMRAHFERLIDPLPADHRFNSDVEGAPSVSSSSASNKSASEHGDDSESDDGQPMVASSSASAPILVANEVPPPPPAVTLPSLETADPHSRMGGGCTAVVALVTDTQIVVGNAGDARAFLYLDDDDRVVEMSVDHRPDLDDEVERIKDQGGIIISDFLSKGHRVGHPRSPHYSGGIAITRSLGDFAMAPVISPEPHIAVADKPPAGARWTLVLGCDGIFDVMSNRTAAHIVRDESSAPRAAIRLRDAALSLSSRDDLSCIVIRGRNRS